MDLRGENPPDTFGMDIAQIALQISSFEDLISVFGHGRFLELVMFFVPGYFEKNAHPVFLKPLPPAPPKFNVVANCSPRGRWNPRRP